MGYDNERGKGDHRHSEGAETSYEFTSVEQLMVDFWSDVRALAARLALSIWPPTVIFTSLIAKRVISGRTGPPVQNPSGCHPRGPSLPEDEPSGIM